MYRKARRLIGLVEHTGFWPLFIGSERVVRCGCTLETKVLEQHTPISDINISRIFDDEGVKIRM